MEKKELYIVAVNKKLYIISTAEDEMGLEVRTFDPSTTSFLPTLLWI